MEITVHHFYPDLLNTYGDIGNILALKKRCKERRIEVKINNVHIGDWWWTRFRTVLSRR